MEPITSKEFSERNANKTQKQKEYAVTFRHRVHGEDSIFCDTLEEARSIYDSLMRESEIKDTPSYQCEIYIERLDDDGEYYGIDED